MNSDPKDYRKPDDSEQDLEERAASEEDSGETESIARAEQRRVLWKGDRPVQASEVTNAEKAVEVEDEDKDAIKDVIDETQPSSLFEDAETDDFRSRWMDIQTSFVDDPHRAVQDADELVQAVVRYLTEAFDKQRTQLEGGWKEGDHVTTEELRLAMRSYRAFFDRLLSLEA